MSLLRNKYTITTVALLLLAIFPLGIFAKTTTGAGERIVILHKDETVNHDYFAAGNTVTIDGTINGDAYVAGGQVTVNGVINGDLLVAGGQVTVRGNVSQDIRVAGGNIILQGQTQKSVTALGGNITLDNDANIAGNAVIAGGNVIVSSNIIGNVTAGTGSLELSPDATISGNLDYWSNTQATISSSATVAGATTFHKTTPPASPNQASRQRVMTGSIVLSLITSLILGTLLIRFFPIYSKKTAEVAREKFWPSFLTGLVTLVITPILVVILFVTIVGIPLGIILLFAYGILLYISKLFAALALGTLIRDKGKWNLTPMWAFVIGIFLYSIIGFIPVIGALAKAVMVLVGMGAILLQNKHYYQLLRDQESL